ncbi:MAG: Gmad2 immunoglobulin-like domain-containing protein [Candidatus Pacebacteria bacterium]|nr:Gmad2 immunoglobulin-like domain-containing protein [Candidatus Paceibacterota bacterium]
MKIKLISSEAPPAQAERKKVLPSLFRHRRGRARRVLIITISILAVIGGLIAFSYYFGFKNTEKPVACTQEARLCSDGSYIGRTGPNCEFALCPHEDLIRVFSPQANEKISSPLLIKGETRGFWFFEATFPVKLLDDKGNTIAQDYAQAKGDWMTEDFVPFEAELVFEAPTTQKGWLVLEKDNPSDLSENADELRIPVIFSDSKTAKLYYYNPEKDKDKSGNIQCSRDGRNCGSIFLAGFE